MAAVENRGVSGERPRPRQPSRLQRRAPAMIQINPVTEWNVAIPLLSPLVQSPDNLRAEIEASANRDKETVAAAEKPAAAAVVVKKWQHPAAPFGYDTTPFLPFVCTGSLKR
ncbi:uncharacterized protein At4g14450, chloroplastic-like [Andrographis paniculata]|uniref:uncharacterized protein At4g14450, chloroplastic-like n=1 Tax=Andrographis paniculata TaxID=175694 RepID=UPI0021E8E2E1|nr:uncharacterized protein At4g14450, chloroplastic-like [Andrographis paniculata]